MDPISRPHFRRLIERALEHNPVVAVLGPRQCGETTMAREFVPETSANYFDMEDLKLDELVIVYPGSRIYPLSDRVKVLPLTEIGTI